MSKSPPRPPNYEQAVITAITQLLTGNRQLATGNSSLIHGSTVATNALLQRAGQPIAFVTTHGFSDMLLIGRQNRPQLYALHVQRPDPITPEENWFTIRERIDAHGAVIEPLSDAEISRLLAEITRRRLKHAAICLLFSFINPDHERRLGRAIESAG